jgi:hypothetical protein
MPTRCARYLEAEREEGSGFSQRMERMIEQEIEAFTRATLEAKKGRRPP